MAFVAGKLHQDGEAQTPELLQHFGCVIDHGVLNDQIAAGAQDGFVIRSRILSGVGDFPLFHRLLGLRKIPGIRLLAAEDDAVQSVQLDKMVHGPGGHQINLVQRLLQNRHRIRYFFRHRHILPHHQVGLVLADGQQLIALLAVGHRKTCGIAQWHNLLKQELLIARCLRGRLRLRLGRGHILRPTAGGQQQGQAEDKQNQPFFHFATTVAESKVMAYSISWGVLIAVVSAATSIFRSSASTGISNREPPSVVRGRYFSPLTIM